jgi:squalene-hopene/tetraprenyl-beta-curcumene cyclase
MFAKFPLTSFRVTLIFSFGLSCVCSSQEEVSQGWDKKLAAEYLDGRTERWLGWKASNLGNETSCIACHTGVPYLMSRQRLRSGLGETEFSNAEKKTLASVHQRVEKFNDVTLYYQPPRYGEDKRLQSRGTEAIQNALICATIDAQSGLENISKVTSVAFANLWKNQQRLEGSENKGGWSWLDFGLEPWESADAEYYGVSLAAMAVGIAPGNYSQKEDIQKNVAMLRKYLTSRFDGQHLHNKMAVLLASSYLDGLLSEDQEASLVDNIFSKQRPDGGWSLFSLGSRSLDGEFKWVRSDGTDQVTDSDGYATGYTVYVLKRVGVTLDDERMKKAVNWLKSNQTEDGNWRGNSVNKKRNHATNIGKFMDDAATAYAVLALLEK